jgi:hypothetical protein
LPQTARKLLHGQDSPSSQAGKLEEGVLMVNEITEVVVFDGATIRNAGSIEMETR